MSIDFAIELLNGEVKPDLKHRYGTLTQQVIERVGKSLKPCKDVQENLDVQIDHFTAIGRHKQVLFEDDVAAMVGDLTTENLFYEIPGRSNKSFTSIKRFSQTNWMKVSDWLDKPIKGLIKEQRINNIVKQM